MNARDITLPKHAMLALIARIRAGIAVEQIHAEAERIQAALIVPDVGEVEMLDKLMSDALAVDESWTLKLYTAQGGGGAELAVAADFTVATFTGYANKTLTRAGWSAASTLGGVTSTSFAQQSWTCTAAGQTILGYYVIGATSTVLCWYEAFGVARVLTPPADQLLLTPKMQLD